MIAALNHIETITLFVEDLPAAKAFYRKVFGLPLIFEDAVSVVFKLENLMINLLDMTEAHAVIDAASVTERSSGARLLLTIVVQDANAVCAELKQHGVRLLSGPVDQPWGRRVATFADPAGHVWEVAQLLPKK